MRQPQFRLGWQIRHRPGFDVAVGVFNQPIVVGGDAPGFSRQRPAKDFQRKDAKARRITGSDCLRNGSLNSALFFLNSISVSTFAPLHLCAFALKPDCIGTAEA